jgi:hypothetical protein
VKILKNGSSRVMLLALIAGVIAFWNLYIQQTQMFSTPVHVYDSKYGATVEALGLISWIAMVISNCLKKIEERLDKLEKSKQQ